MKSSIAAAVAATACVVLAGPALGQGYAGASFGQSTMKLDCAGTSSCDDTGTGFKIFGGYDFAPNVGVELAWMDLGKTSATVPLPPFGTAKMEIKASALAVYAVGRMPLGGVSVFGKIGGASVKAESDVSFGGGAASDSQSSTGAAFGIGAEYAFTRQVSARAEWERVRAKLSGDNFDIDLLSIGALFRF